MARILYTPEQIFRPTVTATLTELVGDINNLDAGPARFEIPSGGGNFLEVQFNSQGRNDSPTAFAAVVTVIDPLASDTDLFSLTPTVTTVVGVSHQNVFTPGFDLGTATPPIGSRRGLITATTDAAGTYKFKIAKTGTAAVTIDIERIEFMRHFQLPKAVDSRWSLAYRDLSAVTNSDSGTQHVTQRRILRELSFSLTTRSQSDHILTTAGEGMMQIMQDVGRSRPIMVIPRETGEAIDARIAVLGRLVNDPELQHVTGPNFDLPTMTVREI